MNKFLIKTKLVLIIIIFVILPTAVSANSSLPEIKNPFDNLQVSIPGLPRFSDAQIIKEGGNQTLQVNWIGEYIIGIYNYVMAIIGIFAVLGIAIGGIIWLMSIGNPSRVALGKDWVVSSVFGLAIALSSYLILNTINSDLVTLTKQQLLIIKDIDLNAATITSAGGVLTKPYDGRPTFSQNISDFDGLLKQTTDTYGVDCTLAKATMLAESSGNPQAVSPYPANANGLMQLIPATFQAMNIGADPFDPAVNIAAGVKYMSILKTAACDGRASNKVCSVTKIIYRIAAYNGGPGANKESVTCPGLTAWQCANNIGYGQTRDYVKKVQANYDYLLQKGWGC